MAKPTDHEQEVLRRLIAIDHKSDSMEDSLAWLVRASGPKLLEELINAFGKSKRRVQVYLALDGVKNVDAIATHLDMKRQNVTAELSWLKRMRLIDVLEADGQGTRYTRKFFDSVVGLSAALMRKHDLDESGLDPK